MRGSAQYYKMAAEQICDEINETHHEITASEIEDVKLVIFPHVYPSHEFRTTGFVLHHLKDLMLGKTVCDMGCGPGIVGLFALRNGAKHVVQADINPNAVDNAKENNTLNGFNAQQIVTYLSDCFDHVPETQFDLIIFNMPFHSDPITIIDPLQYAFYDPGFISINKFFNQARHYSHRHTQIFIAFSNKGDVKRLEKVFESNGYAWELWRVANTEQEYDNRIYKLIARD